MIAGVHNGLVGSLAGGLADILHTGIATVEGGIHQVFMLVAAAVNVEGVNAVVVEYAKQLDAVFQGSAAGNLVVHGDTVDNGHILAGAALDGFKHFNGETGAVLGAATVFVFSLVPQGREELVYYVAHVAVNFDCIKACGGGNLSGQLPGLHDVLYLLDSEGAAEDVGIVNGGYGGGRKGSAFALAGVGVTSGSAGKLGNGLCTIAMDALGKSGQMGNDALAVKVHSVNTLCHFRSQVLGGRDYSTDTTLGALFKIPCKCVRARTVHSGGIGSHGRHDQSVLYLHFANAEGSKQ